MFPANLKRISTLYECTCSSSDEIHQSYSSTSSEDIHCRFGVKNYSNSSKLASQFTSRVELHSEKLREYKVMLLNCDRGSDISVANRALLTIKNYSQLGPY